MKRSEALNLRKHIENAVQSLPDAAAMEAMILHPVWKIGIAYSAGYKALWEEICETHDGSLYNPIPYEGSMALENGKYYSQDGVTYMCNRDTINPVYNQLRELVGTYVEIVN